MFAIWENVDGGCGANCLLVFKFFIVLLCQYTETINTKVAFICSAHHTPLALDHNSFIHSCTNL